MGSPEQGSPDHALDESAALWWEAGNESLTIPVQLTPQKFPRRKANTGDIGGQSRVQDAPSWRRKRCHRRDDDQVPA
jgi:hypothetical protein